MSELASIKGGPKVSYESGDHAAPVQRTAMQQVIERLYELAYASSDVKTRLSEASDRIDGSADIAKNTSESSPVPNGYLGNMHTIINAIESNLMVSKDILTRIEVII